MVLQRRVSPNGAGWSSSVARWAHNPEVTGSNPVPATFVMSRDILIGCPGTFLFFELESFGHAAFFVAWLGSWFEAAGLAVFVGVDGEFEAPQV